MQDQVQRRRRAQTFIVLMGVVAVFGDMTYEAARGLSWWVGSASMGWLCEQSLPTMVAFSFVTQLAAAVMFVLLGRRLREGP